MGQVVAVLKLVRVSQPGTPAQEKDHRSFRTNLYAYPDRGLLMLPPSTRLLPGQGHRAIRIGS